MLAQGYSETKIAQIFESFYRIACFVRNFSLPLLLFGEVRNGHLQHGQAYPSWNRYTSHLLQYFIPTL